MSIKQRVSLTVDHSLGYGHLLQCCGKCQPVHISELRDGDMWHCADCNKPLMICVGDQFYEIGDNITI